MARITIGVPVYNAESLLEESLEGLRAQTFTDWEAVVSDNASEDATPAILERFAAREPRIRWVRQPENLGAAGNFRFVLEEAKSERFLWRAYDDLFSDDYLARLSACLDRAPGADLAAPHVETVRLGTGKRRARPVSMLEGRKPRPTRTLRFSQAGWIYGLWRRAALGPAFDRALRALEPDLWGWDHLALFPAILGNRVVFDDGARLTLRLVDHAGKRAWSPDDRARMQRIARAYRRACRDEMDRAGLAGPERWLMELAVMRQVDRRVVSLRKRLF